MSKKILVIDDNKFFSTMIRSELEKFKYEVTVAENGKEGVDLAKKVSPDLIIVDLIMPIMDGFDAISEIKKDPNLKGIKIVASSNLSQKEDIEKAKTLGADAYIVKQNLSFDEIVEQVKKLV